MNRPTGLWKAFAIAAIWIGAALGVWKMPIFYSEDGGLAIMVIYVCAVIATGMVAGAKERTK